MAGDELAAKVLGELFAVGPLLAHQQAASLERRHLTQPRVRLLFALERSGPVIMTELSCVLGVTPRAVTALVDGLEGSGLIERAPHPHDRRATVVALTGLGLDTCEAMRDSYRSFADALLGDCRDTDLVATLAVLGQVRAGLEALLGIQERAGPAGHDATEPDGDRRAVGHFVPNP
jgi:DNA-binding MarR family transcriptional regulator